LQGGVLGHSAVLGRRVPDRTGRIHVIMGPVDAETFAALIPGGREHVFLKRLVRCYIGVAISCRVTIKVRGEEVPGVKLGRHGAIGLSGWLGATRPAVELTDCHFDV
jgi:type VI secretion system protein ImpH